MSPRTGRPKADNPKDVNLTIRLDAETNQKLWDYCEEHETTRGHAIRQGIHLLLAQKNEKQPDTVESSRLLHDPKHEVSVNLLYTDISVLATQNGGIFMFEQVENVIKSGSLEKTVFGMSISVFEMTSEAKGVSCRYGADCFSCPRPDCVVNADKAPTTNMTAYELQHSRQKK